MHLTPPGETTWHHHDLTCPCGPENDGQYVTHRPFFPQKSPNRAPAQQRPSQSAATQPAPDGPSRRQAAQRRARWHTSRQPTTEATGDWALRGRCRTNADPDAMFVQGAEQNDAKRICHDCPVRVDCLADALDNRIEHGVWGGLTERERRSLLRKHPRVRTWRPLIEAAARRKTREVADAH